MQAGPQVEKAQATLKSIEETQKKDEWRQLYSPVFKAPQV
jgi:hypothetical protein